MENLSYFEMLAETVFFKHNEKALIEILGSDSHQIRQRIAHKKHFSDTTMIGENGKFSE